MKQATTISEVLAELDNIIDWCSENHTPLGYFLSLYRQVTAEVDKKIKDNFFDNGPRMESLDVVFANR